VLVVTRKRNEAIVIGDGIEVRVLRHGRDGVRLGITAPAHVPVHRQEIYETIRAANASAAGAVARAQDVVERLRGRIEGAPARRP
jgi:carbon storage regulator